MATDDNLRREAERREAERQVRDDDPDVLEQESLVHELRVHQIELELQNEELRRTQGVLERARAEFMDLYDEAPVGYASLDERAVITKANRRLAVLLGTGDDVVVGKSFSEFLAPGSQDGFLRRFGAFFREPADKSVDVVVPSGDADKRILQITARRSDASTRGDEPKSDSAITLRIAAVDVTERRRAEAQVSELLSQKELLFRELRHRTSNNYQLVLAMLSLQSDLLGDERVSDAFSQAMRRIEAMLLVQESLADTEVDARTELGTYLGELVRRIVAAVDPDQRVNVVTRFAPASVDADTASSIGLIVNELATNAWKHVFAGREGGRFEVTFDRVVEGWVLAVSDDGHAGAAEEPRSEQRQGLGQTLVEALAGQLGGTFRRETAANGTRCVLRLPASGISAPDENSSDR